jgi:hypothetical protein
MGSVDGNFSIEDASLIEKKTSESFEVGRCEDLFFLGKKGRKTEENFLQNKQEEKVKESSTHDATIENMENFQKMMNANSAQMMNKFYSSLSKS